MSSYALPRCLLRLGGEDLEVSSLEEELGAPPVPPMHLSLSGDVSVSVLVQTGTQTPVMPTSATATQTRPLTVDASTQTTLNMEPTDSVLVIPVGTSLTMAPMP